MGKLAQSTSKYTVLLKFETDGTVEKPDVIGAVFGQTEGLLGPEMDLRELQKSGRVGRVDVSIQIRGGKAFGEIEIPSSLDASETALLAACMETIERIGPCNSRVLVDKIEDVRTSKRKFVIDRAKQLLQKIFEEGIIEPREVSEQIKDAVRAGEVVNYKGCPAGPAIDSSNEIIICEGRADVVSLLRAGIKNCIAIEGTSVPQAVAELSRTKECTAFLDGDRGGDLILKELTAVGDIEFVARAPEGKEVEELSSKEIHKALRDKVPLSEAREISTGAHSFAQRNGSSEKREMKVEVVDVSSALKEEESRKYGRAILAQPSAPAVLDEDRKQKFREILNELTGSRAAYLLDEAGEIMGKVPARELINTLRETSASAVFIDGEVDQKLVNLAAEQGAKFVGGMKLAPRLRPPEGVSVLSMKELEE